MVKERFPSPDAYGGHRVVEPRGALPQGAWRLDATPEVAENEILCDVLWLAIDSSSFRQIDDVCKGDVAAIAETILGTVAERGKQQNAVTGSGGMFVGEVAAIGATSPARERLRIGDRIASLVSLTLTPLVLERIESVDRTSGRIGVSGKAVLFASGCYAKLPTELPIEVALALFDVAGAPAQVARLATPGMSVLIVGADGKSGMLSAAAAKRSVEGNGRVVGVVPHRDSPTARLLLREGYLDAVVEADAREALALLAAVEQEQPELANLVVNCVNVPGTEMGSILCTREGGTLYFFSMATAFAAAALGAEGVGKDISMLIGNGYARGHAAFALDLLADEEPLREHFIARYGASVQPTTDLGRLPGERRT